MPVTERLMLPATWSLKLDPSTPKSVRDALVVFGHVFVMDAPVEVRIISDASVQANARYAGILRHRASMLDLEGPGLLAWLGDEESKGSIYSYTPAGADTFLQWMTRIITTVAGGAGPIRAGTLTAVGAATYPNVGFPVINVTQRYMLDFMCAYFGGEYRINPNATIDAGPSSSLFVITPTSVVVPREGSRDPNIVGIEPSALGLDFDGDSYTTDVKLIGATGTGTANGPATPYKDMYGTAVRFTRVVTNSQVVAGAENKMATAELNKNSGLHQQVTLASGRYDIPRDIAAGDWIYVYDPDNDLIDVTNPVNYRGQIVFPTTVRTLAITWPVERGMGVYYRDLAGVYTDLTPWIVWEPSGTLFEVASAARKLLS